MYIWREKKTENNCGNIKDVKLQIYNLLYFFIAILLVIKYAYTYKTKCDDI